MDQNGSIKVLFKKKRCATTDDTTEKQQMGGRWTKESKGALMFCGWGMNGMR